MLSTGDSIGTTGASNTKSITEQKDESLALMALKGEDDIFREKKILL